MITELLLEHLSPLVGTWTTEATHPESPGLIVHGTAVFEWLDGERFLIHRTRTDHVDFPDSISIIGVTNRDRLEKSPEIDPAAALESPLSMHYFDSRGVYRVYGASVDGQTWRLWRDAPGFSQRFTGNFADRGHTIVGQWQLCRDDITWNNDLRITYRRQP
jgi:hypothetical protein